MSIAIPNYMEAIEHLPDGATLVFPQFSWDDYERLLDDLAARPHLSISFDCGRLEIMSHNSPRIDTLFADSVQ